jgi:hypothetical protein
VKTFRVYPYITVSTTVEIDAEDENEAIEKVLYEGLPGLMFLDHTFPDEGDWQVDDDGVEEIGADE